MKVAVVSGKGGTGKTFVSVNLALASGSAYADCDVEEPNGPLFFNPTIDRCVEVDVMVPRIDPALCKGCRRCTEFCRFNALAFVLDRPRLFPEVCHSCGGCAIVCPTGAISAASKTVGEASSGTAAGIRVAGGRMVVGEASGVPVVRAVLEMVPDGDAVVDGPPGSGCMVSEALSRTDCCVIVGEPTAFGAHNMRMVSELAAKMGRPCAAVLNKCADGPNPSRDYCESAGLPVLAEIPFDRGLAEMTSEGRIAAACDPEWRRFFSDLMARIKEALA